MKTIITMITCLIGLSTIAAEYNTQKEINIESNDPPVIVLYGQEMSQIQQDERGAYSLALLEFNIKGSNIVDGDKVYHGYHVILNNNGYPEDYNYIIEEIEPHVFKIIGIEDSKFQE